MEETDSNAVVPHKSTAPRARKSWSLVWNDFTKERRPDGSAVAICNHCKKQLTASSRSGTTHLKNHLVICTSDRRVDGRKKRKKLLVRRPVLKLTDGNAEETTANLEQFKFDQELSRQDLSRMIILHQYPLSIVDDIGFKTFVRNLQPQFKLLSSETVKADCMKIYENERLKLYEVLAKVPCRVSLSLETWRSAGEAEHACLACHYVDNDWRLQRKILNLVSFEALSTAEDITKAVMEKLSEWNIHGKLFSMVLDNFSAGDEEIAEEMLKFLQSKDALLSNGELFHLHGYGNLLNLIVQDGLAQISDVINRVRELVKYVKFSQPIWRRFQDAARQVNASQKSLLLDITNSWTSTYAMLSTACEFQEAFMSLAEFDGENSHMLSSGDWDDVKSVAECLDVLYQALKSSNFMIPTGNLYFNDICSVYLLLKASCAGPSSVAVSMASQMLKAFEQYWGITRTVMAIASVLDPRYKMKSIEYFFKLIYNGEYESVTKIDEIRKSLTCLYNDYVVNSTHTSSSQALLCYVGSSSESNGNQGGGDVVMKSASRITLSDARRGLDLYLQESSSNQSIKTDLDMYLEEAVHPSKEGVDNSFNILAWWKVNAPKYPILSMMARDILATPMSPVTLDMEGRLRHQYSSLMDPITMQSLVCAHDWLKDEIEATSLDGDVCMVPANGDELCPLSQ